MNPSEYETMFRVEETHWWYQALHRLTFENLERFLPDWREKSILDAGCGSGAILQRLGNPAKNRGVDLAPEAIAFCQKRGLTNVMRHDISWLPFKEGTFDAVICSSVLYHRWVTDVPGTLLELRRVLRPGGLLFLNLPACKFLHSAHDEAVFTARRFTRAEVRSLLMNSSLSVRKLTYWTTLLFPAAFAARFLGISGTGHDFDTDPMGWRNRTLEKVMSLELALLRGGSLPIGVALFAVAQKPKAPGEVNALSPRRESPLAQI